MSEMGSKARRGQVFIAVVIIVLVLIALFVVLPLFRGRSQSTPMVNEVFWQSNGRNVTSVHLGDEVDLQTTIKTAEQYSGSVVVKVKKDIAYWLDSDYAIKTFPVSLAGGQTTTLEMAFSPDETSHGRMRGYFIEIDFSATNTKWVMTDSYPPRLEVVTVQPGSTTPF